MVQQSSLGIFNGILIKLLYEYKLFGTSNCFIRSIQRTVTGSFNKKKLPCNPATIVHFATKNNIALEGWDRKIHEYKSVDDFFTRSYAKLEWGVSRPRAIVSPSEGTAVAYESVGLMQRLWVKQKSLSLETMGVPSQFLSALKDCTVVYLKLDVNNLHRFYSPVSGTIVARVDHLEPLRMSHSVRPFTLHAGWNILTENRRVILMIDTPEVGVVAMMVVGGIAIDGIDIGVQEGQRVEQGDEIGCFHMGGSAILLAVPRGLNRLCLRDDLAVCSMLRNEFSVRVGDTLAECRES
jgi:phosphatidylserine decarboxylase